MKYPLSFIAKLLSGVYAQPHPGVVADAFYLQGIHFDEYGAFNPLVKPQVKLDFRTEKHLLQEGDVLFAAKGLNNFAVVYEESIGPAVASSSFIVIRLNRDKQDLFHPRYLAWYLGHTPEVKLFHKQLGTTIPSISISALSELEIGLIPMDRQQLILQIQDLRYREERLAGQLEEKRKYLINHQLLNASRV